MDKIICIGKNYLAHARELGDAVSEKPVVFLKPPSVLRAAEKTGDLLLLSLPPGAGEVHHECEIVLRLAHGGYCLEPSECWGLIGEVSLGLDMTLRDRQSFLKAQGHPWTTAKVFVDSAVVGPWITISDFPEWLDEPFSFSIDGQLRQQASAKEMRMGPADQLSYLSHFFPLCAGDLIYTGTPKGVGPVRSGEMAQLSWDCLQYSVRWE
jgi:2-keto-4-pentenoate hydratase/2-oxohepta-3-ene-1,7-dioic acid hydratase in catechol pathway